MVKPKISAGKPGGENARMKKMLKQLGEDELLSGRVPRFPVDLHPKIQKEAARLQLAITSKEGKKVSNRMLVTEALRDLFKKYEAAAAGEGVQTDYVFEPGESYKCDL